jgi:hypothetical protein
MNTLAFSYSSANVSHKTVEKITAEHLKGCLSSGKLEPRDKWLMPIRSNRASFQEK